MEHRTRRVRHTSRRRTLAVLEKRHVTPRMVRIVAGGDDFDWWLLIGDETALPSIGRRIEGLAEGVRAISLVAVTGPAEEQVFNTRADHQGIWVHRSPDDATNARPVVEALKRIELPPGEGFVWVAAEARVARAAREHIVNIRRHPLQWLRASGYWIEGRADAYERLDN